MIKRKNYKNFLVMVLTLILLFGCKTTPMISVESQKSKSNDIEVQKNNSDDIEEQISKAKLVSTYGDMSTIDEMDTVTFGSYPQSSTSADKLEPIEWIVLERDYKNNRALLLSKYILDNVSFNSEHKICKWKDSELRQWMNQTFYEKAFNENEKNIVVEDSHISDIVRDDKEIDTVTDKVFILSESEAKKYFKRYDMTEENRKLATRGTNYAKNVDNNGTKLWVRENTGENTFGITEDGIFYNRIVERYKDEALKFEWCIGNSFYWLRSNGLDLTSVARVNSNGALLMGESNYSVANCQGGIRPAVWVRYNKKENNNNQKEINDFEIIEFGKYQQSYNSEKNDWNEDPIEWIVLEKDSENKRALIISKYILDVRPITYKSGEKNTTWGNSNIRAWLNDEFYNSAFTAEEKNKIKEVQLVNEDNDDYMTLGGRDTTDKIFLLSISEARKYFSNGDNLGNKDQLVRAGAAKGTEYAKHRRLGIIPKNKQDEYEEWMLENSAYNLRSPGGSQERTAAVGPDAIISTSGFVGTGLNRRGVRPAMWIEY